MTAQDLHAPWVAHATNDPAYIDIDTATGERVCSLSLEAAADLEPPTPEDVVWARARAMAAAPDSLALLSEIVAEADRTGGNVRRVSRYLIDKARALVYECAEGKP